MSKKIYILFIVLMSIFLENIIISNSSIAKRTYLNTLLMNDYSKNEVLENLDYKFEGCIISKITTSQFNGNGTDIPYTYYYVKISNIFKGSIIEEKVVIKYYGGYDKENNLILLEGMEMPVINEKYIFYCNKTKSSFELDGRTINGSYVIDSKYKIQSLYEKNEDNMSKRAANLPTPDDGGDGSVDPNNFTINTAKVITLNYYAGMYIGPNKTRYYKFTCTTTDYISIYSIGDYDPEIFLYDSNQNLIDYDDNDDDLLYSPSIATGNNFYLNLYGEPLQTYYAAIKLSNSSLSGSFAVQFKIDNWAINDITDYILENNLVNNKNEINYEIDSNYGSEINYSINEWNKLGTVKIQPRKGLKIRNLKIKDSNDLEGEIIAVTNYLLKNIRLNVNCFEQMNSNQRIHTILHELGHALGIDEMFEYDNNVMVQGLNSITKLGPADIGVYREIWGYNEEE